MLQPRDDQEPVGAHSLNAPEGDSETSGGGALGIRRRRHASVFDAVAGRISTRDDEPLYVQTDDSEPHVRVPRATRHPTRSTILSPEEVLFRRKEAPLRWPHHDIYMAHERDLPDEGRDVLPPSDLLKTLHSYTSLFYDALGSDGRRNAYSAGGRNINERSMDETALLALGILLEEAGKEVIGARGDMVFTEEDVAPTEAEGSGHTQDDLIPENLASLSLSSGSDHTPSLRGRKRRRVSRSED